MLDVLLFVYDQFGFLYLVNIPLYDAQFGGSVVAYHLVAWLLVCGGGNVI